MSYVLMSSGVSRETMVKDVLAQFETLGALKK